MSGAGDVNGDGIVHVIIGAPYVASVISRTAIAIRLPPAPSSPSATPSKAPTRRFCSSPSSRIREIGQKRRPRSAGRGDLRRADDQVMFIPSPPTSPVTHT